MTPYFIDDHGEGRHPYGGYSSMPILRILLLIAIISLLPSALVADQKDTANQAQNTSTYSLVHLSDTQNLATHYPDTYDLTFLLIWVSPLWYLVFSARSGGT